MLEEEKNQLTYSAPVEIIKNHYQIFISSNKTWYYLNPDLVIDESKIVLCETCSENPIEHQFSIANGHDYGRIGNLPKLSNIAQNAISPIRIFGQTLKINDRTCIGHFFSFTSDGLDMMVKKILPSLSKEELIQITFIGGKILGKTKT